ADRQRPRTGLPDQTGYRESRRHHAAWRGCRGAGGRRAEGGAAGDEFSEPDGDEAGWAGVDVGQTFLIFPLKTTKVLQHSIRLLLQVRYCEFKICTCVHQKMLSRSDVYPAGLDKCHGREWLANVRNSQFDESLHS